MKLIKKNWQSRRDFEGVYECEKCKNKETASGYDDRNFHENVTPNWKCKECGESTNSLGVKKEKVNTVYSADTQV